MIPCFYTVSSLEKLFAPLYPLAFFSTLGGAAEPLANMFVWTENHREPYLWHLLRSKMSETEQSIQLDNCGCNLHILESKYVFLLTCSSQIITWRPLLKCEVNLFMARTYLWRNITSVHEIPSLWLWCINIYCIISWFSSSLHAQEHRRAEPCLGILVPVTEKKVRGCTYF